MIDAELEMVKIPKMGGGVAAGTSPHLRSSQAASAASDWSDVLNLDSVSFIDWE